MFESLFLIIGLLNNTILTIVFILRKKNMAILERFGWLYLLLSIPTLYAIILVIQKQKPTAYLIFLGIFMTFLVVEGVFDHVLKILFRQNWRYLVPYLMLYYAAGYGFVVMVWKDSQTWGIIMFTLTVVQIVANMLTHRK
jgi:hypothetical protein